MIEFFAMLFRLVWGWGTFPHAILVGLAIWAVSVQMTYRVPSRLLFLVLPWVGIVLSCLSLLLLINRLIVRPRGGSVGAVLARLERHALLLGFGLMILSFLASGWLANQWVLLILLWGTLAVAYVTLMTFVARLIVDFEDSAHRVFWRMVRAALLFVGGFILYSLVLFLNGALDSSLPIEVTSEIVDIGGAEVELWGFLPYSWGSLQSWRQPSGIERIFLTRAERSRAWPGQAVLVRVHRGHLGIPWVSAVARDEEKYAQQVMKIAPTAAGPRKNLIRFYLERRRWKEASAAGQEYLKLYPEDYDFISGVAASFGVARQDADALLLLEPFVTRRPTYEVLNLVGWMLHRTGQSARGIVLLESSIPLEPDNWWAYYHLGYAYRDVGRLDEAAVMFLKVLERRPNYPEIEQQLQLLRQRLRQQSMPPAR